MNERIAYARRLLVQGATEHAGRPGYTDLRLDGTFRTAVTPRQLREARKPEPLFEDGDLACLGTGLPSDEPFADDGDVA